MDNLENKLKVDAELTAATKDLKDRLADLDIAKQSLVVSEAKIERNNALIIEQNEKLQGVLNEIAAQKVAWLQEKADEEKTLEGKKGAVEAVLARSSALDIQEAEACKILNDAKGIRAEADSIRLSTEQTLTAVEVKQKEVDEAKTAVLTKESEIDRKIERFKEGVAQTIDSLSQI